MCVLFVPYGSERPGNASPTDTRLFPAECLLSELLNVFVNDHLWPNPNTEILAGNCTPICGPKFKVHSRILPTHLVQPIAGPVVLLWETIWKIFWPASDRVDYRDVERLHRQNDTPLSRTIHSFRNNGLNFEPQEHLASRSIREPKDTCGLVLVHSWP